MLVRKVYMEPKYCCVFRIGNYADIIQDNDISGYKNIVYNITHDIYTQLGVNIYNVEILEIAYYYCFIDSHEFEMFKVINNKYRGKGIIILYGTQIYTEPLPSHVIGGKDITQVNLILSAIVKLNNHSISVPPVRRMYLHQGQLQVYTSYCN